MSITLEIQPSNIFFFLQEILYNYCKALYGIKSCRSITQDIKDVIIYCILCNVFWNPQCPNANFWEISCSVRGHKLIMLHLKRSQKVENPWLKCCGMTDHYTGPTLRAGDWGTEHLWWHLSMVLSKSPPNLKLSKSSIKPVKSKTPWDSFKFTLTKLESLVKLTSPVGEKTQPLSVPPPAWRHAPRRFRGDVLVPRLP